MKEYLIDIRWVYENVILALMGLRDVSIVVYSER